MIAKLNNISKSKNDSFYSSMGNHPLNVYFYVMDSELANIDVRGNSANFKPLGQCPAILNILYAPFLDMGSIPKITQIPYDQKFFGSTRTDSDAPEDPAPQVFRVDAQVDNTGFGSGHFPRYPWSGMPPTTSTASWQNESKLWQFPYHYVTICDYINNPLIIRNNLLLDKSTQINVKVKQPITMTGGYTIYVDGYKGDKNEGANEGMTAVAGLDLPTSSTQYANFMSSSKAQLIAQHEASNRNEWNNFGRGAISTVTGAFQAGLGAIAIAGSSGTATMMGAGAMIGAGAMTMGQGIVEMIQAGTSGKNRVEQSQAMLNDTRVAPRNVSLPASDVLLSLNRNKGYLWANRYTIDEYYKKRLANYWMLYGYKQNKFMKVDTQNRLRFNYVKTHDVNIEGIYLDKDELEILKTIYNSGIRFWHIKSGKEKMHDYTMDNKEGRPFA